MSMDLTFQAIRASALKKVRPLFLSWRMRRHSDDVVVRGAAQGIPGGVWVIRRPFAARPLAQNAAQAQKDEHGKHQKDDGINIEHVLASSRQP
jgi:hypothetical protein